MTEKGNNSSYYIQTTSQNSFLEQRGKTNDRMNINNRHLAEQNPVLFVSRADERFGEL